MGSCFRARCNWSDTAPALRTSILNQLVDLGSIDEYEIKGALSELSLIDPLRVTRLLMKRIDRQTSLQSLGLRSTAVPLGPCAPHSADHRTRSVPGGGTGLDDASWPRSPEVPLQDDGAELYQLVAGDWNDQALATLSRFRGCADRGRPDHSRPDTSARARHGLVRPSAVDLQAAPPGGVAGQGLHRTGVQALLTTTGVITKRVGDRSEKEEQELEQARRITENLPHGSVERRFFEQLADRIEVQLSWTVDPPHPQYDGREW